MPRLAAALALLALGCDPSAADLVVQLRTDCEPGLECGRVEARTDGRVVERALARGDLGARDALEIGRFEGVALGDREVRVDLYGPSGRALVSSRRVLVDVRSSTVVTVLLTRDCFGVECGERQSCVGGACVDLMCLTGEEPSCPEAECQADGDCPDGAVACLGGACRSGVCLQLADDAVCDMGMSCDPSAGCVIVDSPDAGGLDAGGDDAGLDAGATDAGAPDAGAPPERIRRVSLSATGGQGNGGSFDASLSGAARYIVFGSDASDLVRGDTNNVRDAFLVDRVTGAVRRVSVDSAGGQSNDAALAYSIGGPQPLVAFASRASNLVAGDTNGRLDVFVHDASSGVTRRASVAADGMTEGDDNAFNPQLSADGAGLVFDSYATNLGFMTGGRGMVYWRELLSFNLQVMSVMNAGPTPAIDGDSDQPHLSGGGRFVTFRSTALSIAPAKSNATHDVVIRDRMASTNQIVSLAAVGGSSTLSDENARVSADGRWVVFQSNSADILAGDSNGVHDIFLYRVSSRQLTRVTLGIGGEPDGGSFNPSISADGARVVFDSRASNLVGGDTNGARDVFLWDAGVITRLSVARDGTEGDADSSTGRISNDGAFVVFQSAAQNLVPGDTNGVEDVFLVDLGVPAPP